MCTYVIYTYIYIYMKQAHLKEVVHVVGHHVRGLMPRPSLVCDCCVCCMCFPVL